MRSRIGNLFLACSPMRVSAFRSSMFSSSVPFVSQRWRSTLSSSGSIEYFKPYEPFPYYKPRQLPDVPVNIANFTFNSRPISPNNPFGLVTEDSNHTVYRAQSRTGEVFYLKNLSKSKMGGERDKATTQFLCAQETFAN